MSDIIKDLVSGGDEFKPKKPKAPKIPKFKKSKWQKNKEKFDKFRAKQKALIDYYKKQGYQVQHMKYFDRVPKRISEGYLEWYKQAYTTSKIKHNLYKDITTPAKYGDNIKVATVWAYQKASTQRKQIARQAGKKLIADVKNAMKTGYHKSYVADDMLTTLMNFEKYSGVKILPDGKYADLKKDLVKTLKQVKLKDFTEAYTKAAEVLGDDVAFMQITGNYQRAITPEHIRREKAESVKQAKASLKRRFTTYNNGKKVDELSDAEIEELYDIFDTEAWQNYRYSKTGRYESDDVLKLRDEIRNGDINIHLFSTLLESTGDIDEALRRYREEINK